MYAARERDIMKELVVTLEAAPESDPKELSDQTAQLRKRLLEIDVESVRLLRSVDVAQGAKPIDAVVIGGLNITLTAAAVGAALRVIETWLKNRPVRKAKVSIDGTSIEITNVSNEVERSLVQDFIDSHTRTS
jgi:hypothetical protein